MSSVATYKAPARIDASSAAEVERAMLACLSGAAKSVEVDLAATKYVSSAGLRAMLVVAKAAKARGGRVNLYNVSDDVLEVIRISAFDRILNIMD